MNEQFITAIKPINLWGGIEGINGADKIKGTSGVNAFRGVFENAVSNVKRTDTDLADQQYLLATGQLEDAHTVPIAAAKAQLSVDLLVSLRNKALESYNELMRITI